MGCFYCIRPSSKDVRDYDEDMARGSANTSGLVSDLCLSVLNCYYLCESSYLYAMWLCVLWL